MGINASVTNVQNASVSMHQNNAPASPLTPDQAELLLNIFQSHSVNHSGSLPEMDSVYSVLRSTHSDRSISPKQCLRECCLAGTATIQRLICTPIELLFPQGALSELPGTLAVFIDGLTETQAKSLLDKLIDPNSGKLKEQNPGEEPTPGKVFLNAIKTQDVLLYRFLCSAGFACSAISEGLQATGAQNQTALMYAADQGDLETIHFLLQAANYYQCTARLLHDRDSSNQTALICAAYNGHVEVVKVLLRAAEERPASRLALLEACDNSGWTPFICGAYSGNVEIMQIVLDAKEPELRASLFTTRDNQDRLPLMLAGSAEAVTFLLDQGVALGAETRTWFLAATDHYGQGALSFQMRRMPHPTRRPDEAIRALIASGANPSGNGGMTALMIGAYGGNAQAFQALLESVTPETRATLLAARDHAGRTAFMHAASGRENSEVLRILFNAVSEERRVDFLLEQDNVGQTALMLSRTPEHTRLLLTLARKVDQHNELINMRDRNGHTALFWAIWNGQKDREQQEIDRYSEHESLEQIALLIEAGLNPANKDNNDSTALMYAVALGNANIVRWLLELVNPEARVALVKTQDCFGQTAMMRGVSGGNWDLVRALLEVRHQNNRAALFSAIDQAGRTAFMYAASGRGSPEGLRLLFKAVNKQRKQVILLEQDTFGKTALMLSRTSEHMHLLLGLANEVGQHNELMNMRDLMGHTALFWAIWRGQRERDQQGVNRYSEIESLKQIALLIEAGLNPADKDNNDVTALMYAVVLENANIVRSLLERVNPAARVALLKMQGRNGQTALMIGAHKNNVKSVQALLECVDPQTRAELLAARDLCGRTAFMHAALGGENSEVLRVLFNAVSEERRVDLLLEQDNAGQTALMFSKTPEHMQLLLQLAREVGRHNELINMRDQNGETALFYPNKKNKQGASASGL